MDFQTKVLVGMALGVGLAFICLVLWVFLTPEKKRLKPHDEGKCHCGQWHEF